MAAADDDRTRATGGGADDDDDGPLAIGGRIGGRYQVVGFLGKGGMGAVYLAIDEVLGGKSVALKVVARALTDAAALGELRREVVLAQQVTHRNVCRIYDLEQLDGRWMIKMECVSGETLAARIARGPIAVDAAVAIARQIAEGLAAAHAQGVIHRDLKPGNVMVEAATGRVVLMDFGIAREAGDGPAGDISGTPAYMAPEQLRGGRVDARTDVYALGWVLHHMLAGRTAGMTTFTTSTAPTTDLPVRRLDEPLPDPRAGRPDVPAWLSEAILAMLAIDPDGRPADGAAAVRALSAPAASVRAARRWPWLVGVGAVAAIAVAAVVIVVATHRQPAARGAGWHAAIQEIEPSYDENIDSVAFSPDGTKIAYASDRERTGWLRARIHDLATGTDVAITPPDVNALNVSWTRDGTGLLVTDIAHDMATARYPVAGGPAEPIGHGFAVACGAGLLLYEFGSPGCASCPRFVLRTDGGDREVVRLDNHAFVTTYRCDRAGARVVWSRAELGAPFYQPADLWIAEVATGATRQLTTDRKRNSYPTFTPDGASVVFTSARGGGPMNLWELPLAGGEPVQLTFGNGNDLFADVSPDGTQVAFDVDVTSAPLFRYPAAGGGARTRVTPSRVILIDPQVTPDGRAVIAADFSPVAPRIVAVGVDDGEVRALADGVTAAVTPDGATVVYASDGEHARIAAVAFAGGAPRDLGTIAGHVRKLRVGPDGVVHAMVDRDGSLEAWRVPLAGGEPEREFGPPWCFIQPAPAGEVRVWLRCRPGAAIEGVIVYVRYFPPDLPAFRLAGPMFFGGDFDATGATYFAYDQPAVRRIDVATGAATTLFEAAAYGETVSPDGATIFTTEAVGAARRHVITNFASRPRPGR